MSKAELDRWNERYKAPDYIFGTAPNAFLAANARRLKRGQSALSVADGEGRNSVWLAEQGLDVSAFDFSPYGVEKARKLAASRGVHVRYELASVYDWSWPAAAFEVVVAIFVQFADPKMRAFMFERMARALKPAGLLLIEGYTPKQLQHGTGGPRQLDQLYTEELLRREFAGFDVLDLREYEAALDEGSRHRGISAVIDFVARKP
jgi:ubiquinone/menaquinone biosynthesis C-methylase UbiE